MCYYATTDYSCGDWKWGNMMERCPRQHRIGETCGAKLVHHESVTKSSSMCKICEEINTKQRRLVKTYDNIQRWSRETDKFSASLDKAKREARELEDKIKELQCRRPSVAMTLGGGSRPQTTSTNALPPLAASYEYQSPQASLNRRQDTGAYSTPRISTMTTSSGHRHAQSPGIVQYSTGPVSSHPSRPVTRPNVPAANVSVSRHSMTYLARR